MPTSGTACTDEENTLNLVDGIKTVYAENCFAKPI